MRQALPSAKRVRTATVGLILVLLAAADRNNVAAAPIEFEREPIDYQNAPVQDRIHQLKQKLERGEASLKFDERHGYLPAILDALDIPISSQVLVFSRTSLQIRRISPDTPRALYFDDDTYVGWIPGSDVIELMGTDPQQGEVFYTINQERAQPARILRDRGQCLICHASSRTQGVPGVLMRSVFADSRGQPQLGSGTFSIDHRSPFENRFGGWYVTGTHGDMRHMGNAISRDRGAPQKIDREAGANVRDLSGRFDVKRYLTPHSDLVALMVLAHQTQMHNYLTLASYETRLATHHDGIMNAALDRPDDYVSDTTQRRIASAGEKLVRYMLFCDEALLTAPIAGTSSYADDFQERAKRDSQGRSLRDLDLKTRLLKYPCSWLIDSPSFDALPPPVRNYVTARLREILTGKDESGECDHLTQQDRQAILEILTETKPDLWKADAGNR
ncbi:hypothetical protein Mal4_23750 [Maioricimonas rarisocia]|uniref:Cytochrome c domain-containing protein n=1 Tax=Maioricimonas rarisocia TaxID=2528026 RepID=A0A517Z6G8_9PLAN|nr:YheU family protein [Maioricimonas rarisocia]QDU38055.1 hypothetical protein Mal4_23750 [Maioricimonas rarisocia]